MTRMAEKSYVTDLQHTATDVTVVIENMMIATKNVTKEHLQKTPITEMGALEKTEKTPAEGFLCTTWMIPMII